MPDLVTPKKRVHCLYRVSTKGQVEKNDIPMQKIECHKFAEDMGWVIEKEYAEKGVSGFKVSAEDRDAIQDLRKDAVEKKFDILLIFMFDRLGRRENETPFVVKWFVEQGVEVWSVREGQQKFENDVDSLVNFLRFWQAEGESKKTSYRTSTRLKQIVLEGRFRGGTAPYGYKLVKMGRLNKKNQEVYDLQIDEAEAAVVRMVFDKYVHEGYGTLRIANWLYSIGITNRKGSNFANCTILFMLKNAAYTGVLKNGDSISEIFEELQIIPPSLFEEAAAIQNARSKKEGGQVPLNTKRYCLLSKNIFCAHCGGRMTVTTSGSNYTKKNGEPGCGKRLRYNCYNKTRHPQLCDGQSGYTVHMVDDIVHELIRLFFSKITTVPKAQLMQMKYQEQKQEYEACLKSAELTFKEKSQLVQDYKGELIKVIRHESCFTPELLQGLLTDAEKELADATDNLQTWKKTMDDFQSAMDNAQRQCTELLSWAQMYDECTMASKKMIVAALVKSIRIGRGYKMDIEFNLSYKQFADAFLADEPLLEEKEILLKEVG